MLENFYLSLFDKFLSSWQDQMSKIKLNLFNDASCKRIVRTPPIGISLAEITHQIITHSVGKTIDELNRAIPEITERIIFPNKKMISRGKITLFAGQQSIRSAESAIMSLLRTLEHTS